MKKTLALVFALMLLVCSVPALAGTGMIISNDGSTGTGSGNGALSLFALPDAPAQTQMAGSYEMEDITVAECTMPCVKGWAWKSNSELFFSAFNENNTVGIGISKAASTMDIDDYVAFLATSDRFCNPQRITNNYGQDVLMYDYTDGTMVRFITVHNGYYYDFGVMVGGNGTVVGNADYEALRDYIAWNIRFN